NRTVSEVKTIFRDHDCSLGEIGSVAWMFNRIGLVEGTKDPLPSDIESEAIEVNAQSVEKLEDRVSFTTDPTDLEAVRSALISRGWDISTCELSFEAKTPTVISDEQKATVMQFLAELSGHDDVRRVHASLS